MWQLGLKTICWRTQSALLLICNVFTNWKKCAWWPFPSSTTCIANIIFSSATAKVSAINTFKSICGSFTMRVASKENFSEKPQICTHWHCLKYTNTWIPSKICPLGNLTFASPPCSSSLGIKSLPTAGWALKNFWTEWPTNTTLSSVVFSQQKRCLLFTVSTSTIHPIWPICVTNTCWRMFLNMTATCKGWSSSNWNNNMNEFLILWCGRSFQLF